MTKRLTAICALGLLVASAAEAKVVGSIDKAGHWRIPKSDIVRCEDGWCLLSTGAYVLAPGNNKRVIAICADGAPIVADITSGHHSRMCAHRGGIAQKTW
jgi:hypothetical protein